MINRLLGITAAAALVAVAGFSAFGTSAKTASAQQTGECVVSGSASISPGLGLVPAPQHTDFAGSASPCAIVPTLNPGGSFGGTIDCGGVGANLVTCFGLANINITSSPWGPCSGTLLQQGLYFEIECQTPVGGFIIGDGLIFPPGSEFPVTNVTFIATITIVIP